jgi:tRNA(Ile)-lysidine synthase
MLEAVVRKTLVEGCGYQEGEPLMVAVSGGADSLALLKILKTLGWPIIAAHFDHHLRESSSQEAAALKILAEEWDLPIVVGEGDVNTFAKRERLGLEESARQCRYQFLFRVAREKGVRAIVTAHHADDQVETILMHFLRGAGFNGLEGMRPVSYLKQFSKEIPIWRPLLGVIKTELLSYCEEQGLVFFNDETNADLSCFRNALRHKLIPEIESIAPRFRQTILRNAKAIQKDNDQLQVGISPMAEKLCQQIRIDALSFNRQQILNSMPGRQTRILKEAILTLEPNLRDIGYEKLLELVEKIKAGTRRSEVGHGLVMQIAGDEVAIQRQGRSVPGYPQIDAEITLEFEGLPQLVALRDGYSMLVETMPWSAYKGLPAAVKSDPMQAFLSFEKSSFPLAIQPLQPGLRWQPLGMSEGSQKLSDSLINAKIPQAARAKYPLLIMADEVAWVPGLRISHAFRLKEKELQVLHLKLQ